MNEQAVKVWFAIEELMENEEKLQVILSDNSGEQLLNFFQDRGPTLSGEHINRSLQLLMELVTMVFVNLEDDILKFSRVIKDYPTLKKHLSVKQAKELVYSFENTSSFHGPLKVLIIGIFLALRLGEKEFKDFRVVDSLLVLEHFVV